jgi:hypothetical protein
VKPPFLFSLGCHSKQAGDERNLPHDVSFFHTTHLPFPHHVQDLISLSCVACGLKRNEAQSGFDASFDEAVIWFDEVVEILHLSQFTGVCHGPFRFQFIEGFGRRSVFVSVDQRGGTL